MLPFPNITLVRTFAGVLVVTGVLTLTPRIAPAQPSKSPAGVKAPPGFDITMFAAPPSISYPTCLAASPDGVLFVGVDLNSSLGARPGRGKVVRCIDTNGDGKADEFKTFCSLDSPRGLWWDNDKTLYVLHPPFLTAFHDDNGDGVADRSDVLVSGLGFDLKFRGADHTTNGFRMAIDGWFYIAVGDYGFVKAVGKDGRTSQLHGGGVVRVRPDGTGLEIVSRGQRNIYDVAVSPTLDLFTRDNTNDGGGWDVRLSHVVPMGNFGYPRLFKNFPDEIIQPLADYGGGSPTGSMFLDEPGYPAELGTALYTVEWGRSAIFRHPLTPNGATWKAGQESFLNVPRPTDMDVDGSGRLYVSSWTNGGYDFSNPNIGYVLRLTPPGYKFAPFPDLKKATDAELLKHLASPSATLRLYASREILKRGDKGTVAADLTALAASDNPLSIRIAAMLTLRQLRGTKANDALVKLASTDALREYALRAISDAPEDRGTIPAEPFLKALSDPNPRVRLQAVIGVARIGKEEHAKHLLPLVADTDPIVAHVAVHALVSLKPIAACLAVLDGNSTLSPGVLRVLQLIHDPAVVSGLIERLRVAKEPTSRRAITVALARLYNREADWDGKWWSTRPDTTGPYYKPATWSESARIADVLKQALREADADTAKWLIPELVRHRVDLPEVGAALLKMATSDAAFRPTAVQLLADKGSPPTDALPLFAAVATDTKADGALRAKAARGLMKLGGNPKARDGLIAAFTADERLPNALTPVWAEFARDGRHVSDVATFTKLAKDGTPAQKELAFGVLGAIAERNLGAKEARAAADAVVIQAFSEATSHTPLLRAVSRMNLAGYAPQVRKLTESTNAATASAAKTTLASLRVDAKGPRANEPTIGTRKYEDVLAIVMKDKGDAALGEKLFQRTGCANCHAVAANETLKGPLLAGIGTRYKRDELVESVLKPSAKIAQGFETFTFNLASGKSLVGFVVRESGTELEVRDATGAAFILKKDDIDEKKPSKTSVMPEKLVDHLTPHELAAILAYLESLPGK